MGPNYALPEAAETPELRLGRLLHQQQDGPGFRSQERKSGREKNSIWHNMKIGCQDRVTPAIIESRKPHRVTQANTSSHASQPKMNLGLESQKLTKYKIETRVTQSGSLRSLGFYYNPIPPTNLASTP